MAGLVDEGFICPVCMKDQRSADNLASHFQTSHNEEPPDVLDQVKGLFGRAKAKAKMLFEDQLSITSNDSSEHNQSSSSDRTNAGSGGYQQQLQFIPHLPPQEPGITRRHTDLFKRIRDAHVDELVTKTNTLVIRLSKLTSDKLPTDENKRKVYEQKIVPWVDDSLASHCKTCDKKFNIRRRKHHCRLCGDIICDKCSYLLTRNSAETIATSVTRSQLSTPTNPNKTLQSDVDHNVAALRLCGDCQTLIDDYQNKLDQKFTKPDIVILYEKMKASMEIIEDLTPEYEKMAQSFWAGETTYSLDKAEERKQELSTHLNNIQTVSKKIMMLGSDETDSEARLQKLIRSAALVFIQEHSSGLAKLPEQSELEILITQRDEQRRRKVEQELLQAKEQERRARIRQPQKQPTKPLSLPLSRESVPEEGWKPDTDTKHVSSADDPMVQQINIIKNYIKQATQAQKWDEVEMLEMNLKHLEDEYFRTEN